MPLMSYRIKPGLRNWQKHWFNIIYESDSPSGKFFDVVLILAILISIIVVMLDSVQSMHLQYGPWLYQLEWVFTILFTFEYIIRLMIVEHKRTYAFSFYGVVDLLAIIPTYISALLPGTQYLLVIRVLRVLRVFRVLKLAEYMLEANVLAKSLARSARKILVFVFSVLILVTIFGAFMYLIEGEESGFTSIPKGVYWAIVTITTVGFGDITPRTELGQMVASIIMIMGYGIIAVPTGIVTVELAQSFQENNKPCPECGTPGHSADANYCRICGHELSE